MMARGRKRKLPRYFERPAFASVRRKSANHLIVDRLPLFELGDVLDGSRRDVQ